MRGYNVRESVLSKDEEDAVCSHCGVLNKSVTVEKWKGITKRQETIQELGFINRLLSRKEEVERDYILIEVEWFCKKCDSWNGREREIMKSVYDGEKFWGDTNAFEEEEDEQNTEN